MFQKQALLKCGALPVLMLSGGMLFSAQAGAAIYQDSHGNMGYDTAAECDAAVQSGNAKFYQSATKHAPLRQKGEKSVKAARLSDLGSQYRLGSCDVGVGRKQGRDGVDRKLQGKYIPFGPSMPINAYLDASGQIVRASMQVCDNRFSAALPRPVSVPAVVVAPVVATPPVVKAPPPVVVAPPVVVVQAPVAPVQMSVSAGVAPYIFGTIGAQKDAVCHLEDGSSAATLLTGQVGLGMNFNAILGAEVYAQGSKSHKYNNAMSSETSSIGARLTVGTNVTSETRVFGKIGVANVKHTYGTDSQTGMRPVIGLGLTYDLTPSITLRGDADVTIRHNESTAHPNWSNDKYLGLGLQFKF